MESPSDKTLKEIWDKAMIELAKFKEETGLDTTTKEGRRRWKEWLGVPIPIVPSAIDSTREASCLTCHDNGVILRVVRRDGNVVTQTKTIPCPDCSTHEEERAVWALEHSGIPKPKRICNFMSFNKELDGVFDSYDACLKLSTDFWELGEKPFKLLLLYGGTGNGKTHLAYAAGIEASARGMRVMFYQVGELLSNIRRAMDNPNQSPEVLLDEVKACDFLILDDLRLNHTTGWQEGIIEDIINYRYSEELPLIVTTNSDQTQLPQPLLSRFKDAELSKRVLNSAQDYRSKKGKR